MPVKKQAWKDDIRSRPTIGRMASFSNGVLVDCDLRIHEIQQLKFTTSLYKRWKVGLRNTELHCIRMKPNRCEHKGRTRKSSHAMKWKVYYSYHYLEDSIPPSFHGGVKSTQMESTLSKPSKPFQVNESTNLHELSPPPLQRSENSVLMAHYIPVYVMLPLDTISKDNVLVNVDLLHANLRALKAAHVDGVMVDVWWGIVERGGPKQYDWSAYRSLFQLIQSYGFKLQTVMSFHQCGGNVGDSCYIQLPEWVCKEGESNPDIFFTNRDGKRNKEYLSFGIDDKPVLCGRTAVEAYTDFMRSFRQNMHDFLKAEMITEIEVGLGPAGELRYPSFPASQGWHFPGIGEFQCYDKYLLSDLKQVASNIGQNEWGYSGPEDAGHYNDWPQGTGFFCNHGSVTTDYGRFFVEWYSNVLLKHGNTILEAASDIFVGCKLKLAAKIAGIHWWYNSRNHAAELAAGYYNLRERDGYKPIAKMLAQHRAVLNFTCIEMRDEEHYWEARCGPEGLVRQVLNAGWSEGIEVSCENALPRYDRAAFDQILRSARPDGISKESPPKKRVFSFTYLRLGQDLMQENHWREFISFVRKMHAGLDYHPEAENYFHPRVPLKRSTKPLEVFQEEEEEPSVPVASVPLLDQYHVPLAPMKERESLSSQDAPGGGLEAQVEDVSVPFPFNLIKWLWSHTRSMSQPTQEVDGAPVRDDALPNDDFPGFSL